MIASEATIARMSNRLRAKFVALGRTIAPARVLYTVLTSILSGPSSLKASRSQGQAGLRARKTW